MRQFIIFSLLVLNLQPLFSSKILDEAFNIRTKIRIKNYLQCGVSKREISTRLGVHKSIIYRELQRTQIKRGGYKSDFAQELSEERKERFGDWEIDLIVENNKGAMVTIIERTTVMFIIRKLKKGKNAQHFFDTVIDMLLPYKETVKSITSNNETEFAEH